MPYPVRQRKKPDVFQAFEEGEKHALVSQRVENSRKKRKDRERKTVGVAEDSNNNVEKASDKSKTVSKKAKDKAKPKDQKTAKKNV